MGKLKVKELPKEEQEKIIAQMKDLQIRGIYTEMNVETANKKIEDALKAKENPGTQNGDGNVNNTSQNDSQGKENGSDDTQDGDDKKDGENESTETTSTPASENDNSNTGENSENEVIVAGDGGVHVVPAENEQTDEDNSEDEPGEDSTDKQTDEDNSEDEPEPAPESVKTPKKRLICHICRSEVIDGKCTGCGYEFKIGG